MSWFTDLFAGVRRIILIEDRIDRLDASVDALTEKVSDVRDRVIRLEGIIEGAMRSRPRRLPPD